MASSNRSPSEGLPVRGEGSLAADGAENGSTPAEAVALRLETLLCGPSQGSTGGWLGSHGGGGLLEVGGAIQGDSTLEVLVLPSRESHGSVPPGRAAA